MRISLWQASREWLTILVRRVPELWLEPPPVPRPAPRALELPLRHSPVMRWATRLFLGAQLLYLLELAVMRQWLAATLGCATTAAIAWLCLRRGPRVADEPRRLLVTADGRLHLLRVSGAVSTVQLHASTQYLGAWTVLVVARGRARTRVFLGPDTLDPARLAALRRRLLSARNPPEI